MIVYTGGAIHLTDSNLIIESGYEIEYLHGEEANIQELKEETDRLILGQHFIYDKNNNLKVFSVDIFY